VPQPGRHNRRPVRALPDGPGAVAIFSVAKTTGAIRPLTGTLGCVTSTGDVDGLTGVCRKARAVEGAYQVAISGDGRFLYLASWTENGASLFRVAS
jgi:hypothetical protein